MTLETLTTDKVETGGHRTRLVRVVADGDLITASEGGNVLGVFRVNWMTRRDRLVAMLNRVGSEVATLVGVDGAEVIEGMRVAISQPKDRPGRPTKRALLFMLDPAIRVQHARGSHA